MAENGVKTTFLDPVSAIDSVIGNKDGKTSLVPLTDFARQLLGLGIDGAEEWLLAQKWAENPEDVAVLPGQFSSLHHAKKSGISKEIATAQANLATLNAVASTNQALLAQGYAGDAQVAAALAATGINLKGNWSAASGSFPAGTEKGDAYIVNVAGTVGGESFGVGDWLISMADGASTGVYLGNWVRADYSQIALSEFYGAVSFATNGSRMGITNNPSKISNVRALLHIENTGANTNTLLTQAFWEGSTEAPYVNNDVQLIETHNTITSDTICYSWGLSSGNPYNDIPLGVTDGGFRVGVLGWSTSVLKAGFAHAGTLEAQIGVWGRAGFQGSGSPSTGVINAAVGTRGEVLNESPGHIGIGVAGDFKVSKVDGTIGTAYAIFANASGGTDGNYAFYGAAGDFFNADTVFIGTEYQDIGAPLAARKAGNSMEFGFPDAGYGATLGSTPSLGEPFLALCAETDPVGNTFQTRGKRGTVIFNNLQGAMIFSRVPDSNASGQTAVESVRITEDGQLVLSGSIRPATFTVGTLPSAAANGPGAQIVVSDDVGGLVPAFSDGTNWLRSTDRAIITT